MRLRNSTARNELAEESSLGLFDNESRQEDTLMEIDDEPLGDLTPMPRQKHKYLGGSSVGGLSRQRTPSPNFLVGRGGTPNSLQKQSGHPWLWSFDPNVAPLHSSAQMAVRAAQSPLDSERSVWTRLIAMLLCVLYFLLGALFIEYFQLPTTIARIVFTNPAFAVHRH